MKNKKNVENPFCDFSFFMKQNGLGNCNGCKRQRECEAYYENRNKRNRSSTNSHSIGLAVDRQWQSTKIRKQK